MPRTRTKPVAPPARSRTDAVVEGVPMSYPTMAEYRTAQVAALEVWAQKLEKALDALLAQGTAIHGDDLVDARTLEQAREVLGSVRP